eukprot:CAMPEP_0114555410 /NCGR_PEP_ID=MMETSP0114-20121206/8734_1 /TAXON_ID=31324 /ORGANISM="Goniomonas sp, Strain m" /LENGTH=411 /DNA_ID=CAMNT_0001740533 /DNA_START=18 /DNA_END=1253 /DNA_ORIENTATION=+
MRRVAIVSACRTAVGAFGGSLKSLRAPELAALVMRGALDRTKEFDHTEIGDIRFGNCMEDVDALNTSRVGQLLAGIPNTVPAVTINRVCTSAMEATVSGALLIRAGETDTVLVGGVEAMSNAPYLLPDARWGARLQDSKMVDSIMHALHAGSHFVKYPADGPIEWARNKPYIMGITAEFLAQKYKISREEQDEVALRSHNNVERATKEGVFKREILPVALKQKKGDPIMFEADEHFRPGMKMADLTKLPPTFIPKTGTVTAGNSSGINDGGCAMVLMEYEKAKATGQKIMGVINGWGIHGCNAELMGEGPVGAVQNLMARTGRKHANEYDLVEINEAFASQYISVEKGLELKREKCNVNGSGIGMGHPVGSTGARIIVSLLHELERQDKSLGMATLCGGGGVAMAIEVERV